MANLDKAYSLLENDEHFSNIFNAIINRIINEDKSLNRNTAIPNQAMKTKEKNKIENTLYFTNYVYDTIKDIEYLSYTKSFRNIFNKKKEKYIEFCALGYEDKEGDIIISEIVCDQNKYQNINLTQKECDIMSSNILKTMRQHLKTTDLHNLSAANRAVALYGRTSNFFEDYDARLCPRILDFAKAIVPNNERFDNDIITGVLLLPARQLEKDSQDIYNKWSIASLECATINYMSDENRRMTPISIENIKHCQNAEDYRKTNISISNNFQDIPIDSENYNTH